MTIKARTPIIKKNIYTHTQRITKILITIKTAH